MSKRDDKIQQEYEDDHDADGPDDAWDDDGEWCNEPIGSCDNCECNLYAGDEWDGLCNQCAWLLQMSEDDEEEES